MDHSSHTQLVREVIVAALRGRGEPLFLCGPRAVPAAALYAGLHQARRREGSALLPRSAESAPHDVAFDRLTELLAAVWEEDAGGASAGCAPWPPPGAVSARRLLERCEERRATARREHVVIEDEPWPDREAALAELLFGSRLVLVGDAGAGWDRLTLPHRGSAS